MPYFAHTAHWQFLAWVMGILGLILTVVTSGVNEWRLWVVEDLSVISAGVAWVGIWRACFYSHAFDLAEVCKSFSISDSFVPTEIALAQVLTMVAIVMAIAGNIVAGLAMRFVYFGVGSPRLIRLVFPLAGALYMLTATCSLVPAFWNLSSVLTNQSIAFPPEYCLPHAPVQQRVGGGIAVGIGSGLLLVLCGLVFLCYRYPVKGLDAKTPSGVEENRQVGGPMRRTDIPQDTITEKGDLEGMDNLAYQTEESH